MLPGGVVSAQNARTNFIGINGRACSYASFADAIADADSRDDLYIDPGTYAETIGLIDKDLTFFPARVGSNCQQKHAVPTSATVIVDGGGATNAPQGGMLQIDGLITVVFEHMWLRNTEATNGGIIAITNGAKVTLDDVLVTDGEAAALGGLIYIAGGFRGSALNLINGTNVYRGNTPAGDGGGIAIFNSTLNIEDSSGVGVSSNNGFSTAGNNGGGIYADSATINIRDDANIIWNEAGNFGGGIYADDTNINITGGNISNNSTAFSGGGIYITGSSSDLDVANATFDNNSTTVQQTNQGGGAVFADEVATSFTSVSIVNNASANSGGGIRLTSSSPNVIQNSIISNNTAISGAGVIVSSSTADLTVINSTFESNIASSLGGGINCFVCDEIDIQAGSEFNGNRADFGGGLNTFGNGIDSTLVQVEGAEFTGNVAIGDNESKGGGIYETGATVLITDTTFTLNEATVSGGGLYASDPFNRDNAVTVTDSFFDRNKTTTQMTNEGGAGIYAKDNGWTLTIEGTDFSANESANLGGGLAILTTDLILRNSQFDGNDGGFVGGGIYSTADTALIEYSSFTNNVVSSGGGGYYQAGNIAVLTNVEISGNTARYGGGLRLASTTETTLKNVKVNNNTATETAGGIYVSSSTFKMTVDPATCNPFNLGANVYCSEIRGNTASDEGGGFYNISATQSQISQKIATIEHTAILENTAPLGGTAVYLDSQFDSGAIMSPTLQITNSLIADNGTVGDDSTTVESTAGGGILSLHSVTIAGNNDTPLWVVDSTGETDLHNSIIYLNSEGPRVAFGHDFDRGCNNSQATSGSSQSMGGSLGNPQFDPSNVRGAYRLTAASPGVDSCADGPARDTDMGGRPAGSNFDQGAFELNSVPTAVSLSDRGIAVRSQVGDVLALLAILLLLSGVVFGRNRTTQPPHTL